MYASKKPDPRVVLTTLGLLCAALITATQWLTHDAIEHAKDEAVMQRFAEVLPRERFDNNLAQDCITRSEPDWLGTENPVKIFRARNAQQRVALLFQSIAPDGYGGKIELLIAVSADGSVAGVRATGHKETAGLGGRIDTAQSNWIKGFDHLSLQQPSEEQWKVKKDGGAFDALTGATVTSRAVVAATARTLHYAQKNQANLYDDAASCSAR